jgi:subtilisin family serine protease
LSVALSPARAVAGLASGGGDWYLEYDHAPEAQSELPAVLHQVRVAVLDSGIDAGHPAFAGTIVASRSFVGGSPLIDQQGHGTFIAGEIIAIANAVAGTNPGGSPVRLVVGKIADGDGSVNEAAEIQAIRWAVRSGARVINLSIGGTRDPLDGRLDAYSSGEAAAVRYALAHGVVVVAAVGNSAQVTGPPWPYADWPAALPHVIGVSAVDRNGGVPGFSNRDPIFNEIAAPGIGIVSTVPRSFTASSPDCPDSGYSDCATDEFKMAEGTSFAAPQVSAAAALLLSVDPGLAPDQVSWALERTADDATPATGCGACQVGRDALTGWGTLDIAGALSALAGPLPPADPCATSNDAGLEACRLGGDSGVIAGTLDYWEHPLDVYRVHVRRGQTLTVNLNGAAAGVRLLLWPPGTEHVSGTVDPQAIPPLDAPLLVAHRHALTYDAPGSGWYYIETQLTSPGEGSYTLQFATRSRPSSPAELDAAPPFPAHG